MVSPSLAGGIFTGGEWQPRWWCHHPWWVEYLRWKRMATMSGLQRLCGDLVWIGEIFIKQSWWLSTISYCESLSNISSFDYSQCQNNSPIYTSTLNLFQISFKSVSNRFQIGFKSVSNQFQIGFKSVSNQIQISFSQLCKHPQCTWTGLAKPVQVLSLNGANDHRKRSWFYRMKKKKQQQFPRMVVTFLGVSEWGEPGNEARCTYHLPFMLLRPDQSKYWQTKMIVFSVYMNLQVDFVRVASPFAWTVQAYSSK